MKANLQPLEAEGRISFLSVGTKILLKDSMDQYIRTLGDFKTYYASSMNSALRLFSDNQIHVIFTEVDLGDGSAFRFLKKIGAERYVDDDLYIILALEERSDALMALAEELEVDAVLVKPFSALEIKAQVERFKAKRAMPKEPWHLLLEEAYQFITEKKFTDAENNFKQAIECAPGNPIPLFRAGLYYAAKPDFYNIAENYFRKAIEIKPNYTLAISALGSLFLAKHELEKADQCFARAHKISPYNPDRMFEMLRLSVERSQELCKSAMRLDSENPSIRFLFGKLLSVTKDYIGVIRELEKAMPLLNENQKKEAQTFIALARKLGGITK